MLIKSIFRLVTFLIILILVIGFLLPTHYQIKKSIYIEATPTSLDYWLFDLKNWPSWQTWHLINPDLTFIFGEKTRGVGAFLAWQGRYQTGELTFSMVDDKNIQFNILFNDEHLAFSALKIEPIIFHKDRSKYLVSWTIEGEITPPIFAGYLALLHKIILSSALEVGLKNLQSQTAINAPDEVLPSNESIL